MPTYRYRCAKCGEEIEEWQSFSDKPLTRHRGCGGTLRKVLSTPGIVLKGSGFYRTDNRNGSSPTKRSTEPSETSSSTSSSSSSSGEESSSSKSTEGSSGSKSAEGGSKQATDATSST